MPFVAKRLALVHEAIVAGLAPYKDRVHTLTYDKRPRVLRTRANAR